MMLFTTQDDYLSEEDNSTAFTNKFVTVRISVGTTCFLSMIGAIAVILSYVCIKKLRSQGRLILVNLAFMDFGVGLSNFIGSVINFNQYYHYNSNTSTTEPSSPIIGNVCIAQAFFAHYCTGSSVLWTALLAIYMYLLIFCNYSNKVKWFIPLSCLFCYGIPLCLTLWLLLTHRLGFSVYNEAAWCGIIIDNHTNATGLPDYMAITVGYDLWIYLTIILTVTIYVSLFLYLHIKFQDGANLIVNQKDYWKYALQFLDAKLIFIPIAFIALRLWTCILNILLIYAQIPPASINQFVSQALIHLSGMGDSGQGLANGILFVLLTGEVRKKVFLLCNAIKTRKQRQQANNNLNNQPNEKQHLLSSKSIKVDTPLVTSYEDSDVDN